MRGQWLIEPQAADSYLPIVRHLLNGNHQHFAGYADERAKELSPFAVAATGDTFAQFEDAPAGSVAIIKVHGVMMKNDYCGTPGTQTLAAILREADQAETIVGSILHFDTPGGSVDGTEEFANAIAATAKPVVAFVNNMMCSAGMWAGSQANHIMIACNTSMVGSIGTMARILDWSKYDENFGVKEINIFATESTDKNREAILAQEGNTEPYQKNILDPLNNVFLAAVRNGRGDKLDLKRENVLTGKVYFGSAAIAAGLADSIGTLEDAFNLVQSLSTKKNTDTMNLFGKKTTSTGAQSAALAPESEEQSTVAAVASAVASAEADLLAQLQAQMANLTTQVQQSNALIADLQAENARLGAQSADAPAVVDAASDRPTADHQRPATLTAIDQMAIAKGANIDPTVFKRVRGLNVL